MTSAVCSSFLSILHCYNIICERSLFEATGVWAQGYVEDLRPVLLGGENQATPCPNELSLESHSV